MAEQLDLASPTVHAVNNYRVSILTLDWYGARIGIDLVDNNGLPLSFSYTGPTATQMMRALNKANLTNNSLHKRVLNQLISDGKLAGSISGSPE